MTTADVRTRLAIPLLALALFAGACGADDTPSADDVRAELQEQSADAAQDAKEVGQQAGEKAKEVGQDIADGPDTANAASLEIESPAEGSTVSGGTVDLKMLVNGITIVKADGDTSGKTGHFHVFIDRAPAKVGEVMPVEPGIVHSAANPIHVTGLSPGKHTLTVVLGDGAHHRIHGNAQATVTVNAT